jgi:hypothetical protein
VLAQLRATGGRCDPPAISQDVFWKVLTLQVTKGALDDARSLLATHWLASSAPGATLAPEDTGLQILLGQVDDVLRGMPWLEGAQEPGARERWLLSVQLLLTNLKVRFSTPCHRCHQHAGGAHPPSLKQSSNSADAQQQARHLMCDVQVQRAHAPVTEPARSQTSSQQLASCAQEQLDARAPEVLVRPADLQATFEILRVFGAALPGSAGATALEAASPSALHLLVASCSHMYPAQRCDPDLKVRLLCMME